MVLARLALMKAAFGSTPLAICASLYARIISLGSASAGKTFLASTTAGLTIGAPLVPELAPNNDDDIERTFSAAATRTACAAASASAAAFATRAASTGSA